MMAFNPACQKGSELSKHLIKHLNWRKSFTSIATWTKGGTLSLHMPWVCLYGRSKFGSKIDEWSTKKTTSYPTQKMCDRRPTRRVSQHLSDLGWPPHQLPHLRPHQQPHWQPHQSHQFLPQDKERMVVLVRPHKPLWTQEQVQANIRVCQAL